MQAQAAFGGAQSPSAGVPSGWQPARSVSPRGNQRDVSPGRSAGRASGAHFHQPAGESVGSLVFGGGGGGHVPVLNGGGHSRANSMAGARSAMSRAAGAAIEEQSRSRAVAEKNFDRRMKGQPRSLDAQYDAYLDAVEDHTFAKLNAQLGKMERKAEREHNMMNGAAGGGMSTEARNARADARMEGRRSKSPGDLFRRASPSRFHDASGGSVASLLQQPDAAVPWDYPSRTSLLGRRARMAATAAAAAAAARPAAVTSQTIAGLPAATALQLPAALCAAHPSRACALSSRAWRRTVPLRSAVAAAAAATSGNGRVIPSTDAARRVAAWGSGRLSSPCPIAAPQRAHHPSAASAVKNATICESSDGARVKIGLCLSGSDAVQTDDQLWCACVCVWL